MTTTEIPEIPEEAVRIIGSNPLLRSDRKGRMTLAGAIYWLAKQRAWMKHCGGDLAGYIANYGSAEDPDHAGDGAEAIYEADLAQLATYEQLVAELAHQPVAHTRAPLDVPLWLFNKARANGALVSAIEREPIPHFSMSLRGEVYRVTIERID